METPTSYQRCWITNWTPQHLGEVDEQTKREMAAEFERLESQESIDEEEEGMPAVMMETTNGDLFYRPRRTTHFGLCISVSS